MKFDSLSNFFRMAVIVLMTGLALTTAPSARADAHTPQPGSPERKAICDALREYFAARLANGKLPPIVFKISVLRVDDGLAWFEGTPLLKDGSYVSSDILPDIGYTFVLKQSGGEWTVKQNLSRSDVPSDAEAAQIRDALRDVPSSIIPDFWRRTLKR